MLYRIRCTKVVSTILNKNEVYVVSILVCDDVTTTQINFF